MAYAHIMHHGWSLIRQEEGSNKKKKIIMTSWQPSSSSCMMMMCGGDNATTHHGLLLVMKTTPSYIVGTGSSRTSISFITTFTSITFLKAYKLIKLSCSQSCLSSSSCLSSKLIFLPTLASSGLPYWNSWMLIRVRLFAAKNWQRSLVICRRKSRRLFSSLIWVELRNSLENGESFLFIAT